VRIYVGVTDFKWFEFLSARPDIDEVNFWQPSPRSLLAKIQLGDMFLFKLKSPRNAIAGGGYFASATAMPISYAWRAFGDKNGAATEIAMRESILRLRTGAGIDRSDFHIGCILLAQPFFLPEDEWIPQPVGWAANVVRGQYYETDTGEGRRLWEQVHYRLAGRQLKQLELVSRVKDEAPRYAWARLRPGQGIFRTAVASAYNWRCAVTGERVLPVLEAAHIKPYAEQGPNDVSNGLLLRADLHNLFDEGYVSVTHDLRFEVSKKVKEDYENGREYYALQGSKLLLPASKVEWPGREFISWHQENRLRH
jgi:putative restriction endonuclease